MQFWKYLQYSGCIQVCQYMQYLQYFGCVQFWQFSSFAVLAVYAELEVLTKIWVRSVLAV